MCEITVRDAGRSIKKKEGGRMQNIKRGHVNENKTETAKMMRNGDE